MDNFYDRQDPDGYIQRVYSETDGGKLGQATAAEPMVNPPLFAWVEWRYYLYGDRAPDPRHGLSSVRSSGKARLAARDAATVLLQTVDG